MAWPPFLDSLLSRMVDYLHLKSRVGTWWMKRSKFEDLVKVYEPNIALTTIGLYPSLIFTFTIDSKLWLDLKIEKIVAHVFMLSAYMGDKICERQEPPTLSLPVAAMTSLESDIMKDVKALSSSQEKFLFAVPRDAFASQSSNQWRVQGFILFTCRLGALPKRFYLEFTLSDTPELRELKNLLSRPS